MTGPGVEVHKLPWLIKGRHTSSDPQGIHTAFAACSIHYEAQSAPLGLHSPPCEELSE